MEVVKSSELVTADSKQQQQFHVLVVDDSELDRKLVETLLKRSTFKDIVKVLGVFIIPFIKIVQQGAATTCFVALHLQVKGVSGEYFADCYVAKPSNQAEDADFASKLWDFSLSMTNLK